MTRTLVLTFLGRVDDARALIETPVPYPLGHSLSLLLDGDRPAIVGRRPDCDLLLADPTVGQRAVSLVGRDGGVWLDDLGAGGGSFLLRDSRLIERPSGPLQPGDRLGIGCLLFAVTGV